MAGPEVRPPSIACIGVVGRDNQLLHLSLFPPYSGPKTSPTAAPHALSDTETSGQETKLTHQPSLNSTHLVASIEFSFLLQSSLDAFAFRARDRTRVDQDLGLLHAVDERLSVWGWETPTGTKFIIVLDAWGKPVQPVGGDGYLGNLPGMGGAGGFAWGMKDGDLKPAFRALQTAYIRLLQNPFYTPGDHVPFEPSADDHQDQPRLIKSKRFVNEVHHIGTSWEPGVGSL